MMLKEVIRYLRSLYYRLRYLKGVRLPAGFNIYPPYYIEDARNLKVGSFCHIGPESYMALKGGITIGENVIIAPRVSIWTYSHDYLSPEALPYGGPDKLGCVSIGDNVWIGFGAIILPGAEIGEGSIVSAGTVVRGKFPPCSLIAGNPAIVVKALPVDRYEKLKRENSLYLKIKSGVKRG